MEEERKINICVIKIDADENGWHDLSASNSWDSNPYGDEYAIVPEEMVQAIKSTYGYCDITLNEDGTEVVSFVAREIPDFPDPEEPETPSDESVWDELDAAYQEGVDSV